VGKGITDYGRPPQLEVGGFKLWVHGRQFPDSDDSWDGNWLRVTGHCSGAGGSVSVTGSILDAVSVLRFRDQLDSLREALQGEAVLDSVEPNLAVRLRASDGLGHIAARVEITPDHLSEGHWFEYELDQSYLPGVMRQCDAILAEYPVHHPEGRGV
jgi:hypothetical protein